MSPEINSEIEQLRKRVQQLERRTPSRRGRTNLAGAAEYLHLSRETLRKRIQAGEGPRGSKNGRFHSFTFDALDEYAEQGAAA